MAVAAVDVQANDLSITDLGSFSAGTYDITASGVVSLVGAVGNGFDILPDGTPASTVTFPGFTYFNPNGSDIDLPDGGIYGPGGPGRNLGEFLGTLDATASIPSDFFFPSIRRAENRVATLLADGLSPAEPADWVLMLVGIGGLGGAMRMRRRSADGLQVA